MKNTNPKESLLNEALAANCPIPGFANEPHKTDRIDSPVLFRTLLDGGFTSKRISPAVAIIPQLKKLSSSLDLNPEIINRLYLLDILYEQLNSQAHLDPAVMLLLYKLRPSVIRATLSGDDTFIKSSRHPLRMALDNLCSHVIGWDGSLGKNGERYFAQLEKLVSVISAITIDSSPPGYESELKALLELSSRYEQIELRLCQSEQALMELRKNKRIADDAINSVVENKQLPGPIIHFLHAPWRDALHRILALHGHNSKDWMLAIQAMEKLVFCMSPAADEKQNQQKYKLIATMRSSLEKQLLNTGSDAENAHWIDEIESQLQNMLMGSVVALETAPRLTSIDVDGVTASVSSAISQRVADLKQGQWVLCKTESGESVRGKLSIINPEANQWLFVNLLGAKRFAKSTEELGYALATQKIQLLTSKNLFSTLLTKSVELFIKRYQEFKNTLDNTAVVGSQEELKRQSVEKALAEAQRLQSLEKNQKSTKVQPKNPEPDSSGQTIPLASEDVQRVEAEVNSLQIGSWLSMKNRVGVKMSCRVAVVYASTGKMVIVDKSGLRVGEFMRPELVQMIMQGAVEILEKSDSFENSLARVIQTLRKDS